MQGSKQKQRPTNKRLQQRLNTDILTKLWHKYNPKTHNLPVGVSDFAQLIANHSEFYADCTMFIDEILSLPVDGLKMLLFTRPAGWGKSINITMLKYFLNCEVDGKGIPLERQPYRSLFFGGKYKHMTDQKEKQCELKTLAISDSRVSKGNCFTRRRMGEYLTIFLKFGTVKGTNLTQIKRGILQQILKAYNDHSYLKNTQKADTYNQNKKQIQRLLNLSYQTFSKQSIESFLPKLQIMLIDFYKSERDCFILIDDLDYPVVQFLERGRNLNQARDVAHVVAQIFNPILNGTKKLKIIAMAQINILETFVTHYKEFGIFDHKFWHYFGFTQDSIANHLISPLLSKVDRNMKTTSDFMLKKIVDNYGGYICSTYSPKKIETASAVKYLQACIASEDLVNCEYKKMQFHNSWLIEQFVSISGITKIFEYHSYQNEWSKGEKLFPLQVFLNKTNDFLLVPQVNYVSYLHGVVTGTFDTIGKWKITQPCFPNKSVTNAISSVIIDKFKENIGFKDFRPIKIESAKDCCEKFEQMINFFYHGQVQINKIFVNGAFYYRYQYSMGKKFKTSHQYLYSDGSKMIDNVYLPIEKSDQAFIMNFHYEKEYRASLDDVYAEMVYQAVELNEFQRAYEAASLFGDQIQQFILRLVLVMPDEKLEMLKVILLNQQIAFSFKEVQNLSRNIKRILNKQEWSRLRRLGLLKKGFQAVNILHILASNQMQDGTKLDELVDVEAMKRQRRFDPNGLKGPVSRKYQAKHLRAPRPP